MYLFEAQFLDTILLFLSMNLL